MKGQMPQEIEVWYILPAIKRGIAIELVSKGLKQKDIAKLLKVTEASISNYIKSKRAATIELNKIVDSEIKKSAEKLLSAKEDNSNKILVKELQR
ncbi:MAG: helix-turn-helix domain-containing protein, partial [Candidatus Diapherotrites archaeon]|nr:helix-turn-helix domain-containing protein [Candidatus Diapherotrites archaeon]